MLRQHVYYAITFIPGQFVPDVWDIKADKSIVTYDEISIIDSHGWEVSENQWHRNTLFQILNLNEFELSASDHVESNTLQATEFSSDTIKVSDSMGSPSFGSVQFNKFNIDTANSITVLRFELKSVMFNVDTLDSSKIIGKVPILSLVSGMGSLDRSNKLVSSSIQGVSYNNSEFGNSFLEGKTVRTVSFSGIELDLTQGSNLNSVIAHTYVSEESSTNLNMYQRSFVSWKRAHADVKAEAVKAEFVSWFAKAGTTQTVPHISNFISWFAKAGTTNPSFKKETTTFIQSFEGTTPEQSSIRGI